MEKFNYFIATGILLFFAATNSYAQDKEAKITLSFAKVDSLYICKALVTSEGNPCEGSTREFVRKTFV